METITALWLPILVSAVVVFVLSSIIHMGPLWHKTDFPKVPNEDALMNAVRPLNIPPGDYMVPRPTSGAEMKSPEFQEKAKKGPVMVLTMMPPGMINMGQNLILWFLYCIGVSVLAASMSFGLPKQPSFHDVLRTTGMAAFIGYAVALWQNSIWYKRAWSFTIKATFDGLIYAAGTVAVFYYLWPKAA